MIKKMMKNHQEENEQSLSQTFTIYNSPKYHMTQVKCEKCGKVVFLKDLKKREFSKYYRHDNCESTKFTLLLPDWISRLIEGGIQSK